jgi:hypothetical protein
MMSAIITENRAATLPLEITTKYFSYTAQFARGIFAPLAVALASETKASLETQATTAA